MYSILAIFLLTQSPLAERLQNEMSFLKNSSKQHDLILPKEEIVEDAISLSQSGIQKIKKKEKDLIADQLLKEMESEEQTSYKQRRFRQR